MANDESTDTMLEQDDSEGAEESQDIKELLKKAIGVKIDDAGGLRRTLTITVPRDSLQTELDKEFKELLTESTIPGFRKGRAPRRLVEKRFGRDVTDQVQTRIISNAYLAAIDREGVKVLGDPLIWVNMKEKSGEMNEKLVDMQVALAEMKIPEAGDLTFRCEVEVKPEFDLPELEGIEITRPVVEVTDADVNEQIDRLRARRGSYAPMDPSAAVEKNDFLICDVRITVDGAEVKTIDNHPCAARAQLIEGAVMSDFGDKMAGAKMGESRTIEAALPDDYPTETYRGKKAQFELKVLEIKRLQLPPLDKAFLESLGFDGETELRDFVRANMTSQIDAEIRRGMQNQVRAYLLEQTKIQLPEGMSTRQAERIAARRRVELQRQGVPDEEIAKHADELMTSAREQAAAEMKLYFILDAIADKFEIDVSEDELNAQIAEMARAYNKRFDRMRDELARNDGLMMLFLEVRDEKCINRILESAKHKELKPSEESKAPTSAEKKVSSKPSADKSEAKAEAEKPKAKKASKADKEESAEDKAPKAKKKSADSADEAKDAPKAAKKSPRKKS